MINKCNEILTSSAQVSKASHQLRGYIKISVINRKCLIIILLHHIKSI